MVIVGPFQLKIFYSIQMPFNHKVEISGQDENPPGQAQEHLPPSETHGEQEGWGMQEQRCPARLVTSALIQQHNCRATPRAFSKPHPACGQGLP